MAGTVLPRSLLTEKESIDSKVCQFVHLRQCFDFDPNVGSTAQISLHQHYISLHVLNDPGIVLIFLDFCDFGENISKIVGSEGIQIHFRELLQKFIQEYY